MKILLLYTYNPSFLSQFFTELAKLLSESGHEITCFSLKRDERIFREHNVRFIIQQQGGYWYNYKAIFNIVKQKQPDAIISNFSYVNPALLAGKLLGVSNNIAWIHSLNEQTKATARQIFIKKQFLKLSTKVVANSETTKNQIINAYGINIKNVVKIPFWTDILALLKNDAIKKIEGVPKSIYTIGCPGRMSPDKNQKIILQALTTLNKNSLTSIRLIYAGDGSEKSNLQELSKTLKVSKQVEFLGVLSSEEMLKFYQDSDLIILPSLHEAFGLVFIEALALGVPVLVSDAFGALCFIDKKTPHIKDIIFNPTDVNELTQKLADIVNGDYLPSEYFKNLYDTNFKKEVILNQVKALIAK
ncbi:MAG: glycosyltransferase family 4 protein [Winogradskyella arenosi]